MNKTSEDQTHKCSAVFEREHFSLTAKKLFLRWHLSDSKLFIIWDDTEAFVIVLPLMSNSSQFRTRIQLSGDSQNDLLGL